jgi:hypothetical protein
MAKDKAKSPKKAPNAQKKGTGSKGTGVRTGNAGPPKQKGWEFAPFTTTNVRFVAAARVLAQSLTELYGDGVSISSFEKMVAAYQGMEPQRKVLITFGSAETKTELLNQLREFRAARDARDTERETFRGDIAVANVESGIAAILDSDANMESIESES